MYIFFLDQDVVSQNSWSSGHYQEACTKGDLQCVRYVRSGSNCRVQRSFQHDWPKPWWLYRQGRSTWHAGLFRYNNSTSRLAIHSSTSFLTLFIFYRKESNWRILRTNDKWRSRFNKLHHVLDTFRRKTSRNWSWRRNQKRIWLLWWRK